VRVPGGFAYVADEPATSEGEGRFANRPYRRTAPTGSGAVPVMFVNRRVEIAGEGLHMRG
jgi:hypothetical protein